MDNGTRAVATTVAVTLAISFGSEVMNSRDQGRTLPLTSRDLSRSRRVTGQRSVPLLPEATVAPLGSINFNVPVGLMAPLNNLASATTSPTRNRSNEKTCFVAVPPELETNGPGL